MPEKKQNTDKNSENKTEPSIKPADTNAMADQMAEMMKMIAQQNEVISKLAKNHPVVIRKAYETEEHETGQVGDRIMKSTGDAEISLSPPVMKTVDKYSPEKMELLRFMEGVVTVIVHDTTDDTQVPYPPVYNDGKAQYFIRGQEQEVKRKYVEVLARAKQTKFTQNQERDFRGDLYYRNIGHTALVYPFTMLVDPSGTGPGSKGYQWLKAIQQESC